MADMTELKNIVRLGTVQSVNASKMTARVKFKDKGGITSGDLRIIKRPVYVVPAMESGAEGQTAKTMLKYDYNGQMLKEVSHSHEAFVTEWTPGVNDMVLCIMVPRWRRGRLHNRGGVEHGKNRKSGKSGFFSFRKYRAHLR